MYTTSLYIHLWIYIYLTSYVLAVVYSAAMNTVVHVSFWSMVFFGDTPRIRIVGLYGSYIFSFLRKIHILFSIVVVPVYIPTNSIEGCHFFHTFSNMNAGFCLHWTGHLTSGKSLLHLPRFLTCTVSVFDRLILRFLRALMVSASIYTTSLFPGGASREIHLGEW